MGGNDTLGCPAAGCTFAGSVSQVIDHVTGRDDTEHAWETLGYEHSWDFGKTHTTDSNEEPTRNTSDAVESCRTESETNASIPLEDVPGIGSTRGKELRANGYECAADVANATITELSQTPKITEPTARCIQATAREECGCENTYLSRLADSMSADREAVAVTYAKLTPQIVTPEEAEETLRLRFESAPEGSVIHLTEYSIRYRHSLIQAGFETIADVARASIDDLTQASYIGDTRGPNLRACAREKLEET